MNSFKSLVLAFVVIALATSCKKDGSADAANQPIVPATATPAAPGATTTPAEATIPVGPLTSVEFEETEFNFGEIMEGEKIVHVFKFKNTGSEPLVISKAEGSCGCTVPDWPREPIAVGKTGEIKVQYDSRGKGALKSEGGRSENKRVTITANTDPVTSYIYIKGTVIQPDTPPAS